MPTPRKVRRSRRLPRTSPGGRTEMLDAVFAFVKRHRFHRLIILIPRRVSSRCRARRRLLVLAERKVAAFAQQRLGPYRVGRGASPADRRHRDSSSRGLRPGRRLWLFYLAPIFVDDPSRPSWSVRSTPTDFFGLLPSRSTSGDGRKSRCVRFRDHLDGRLRIVLAGWRATASARSWAGCARRRRCCLTLAYARAGARSCWALALAARASRSPWRDLLAGCSPRVVPWRRHRLRHLHFAGVARRTARRRLPEAEQRWSRLSTEYSSMSFALFFSPRPQHGDVSAFATNRFPAAWHRPFPLGGAGASGPELLLKVSFLLFFYIGCGTLPLPLRPADGVRLEVSCRGCRPPLWWPRAHLFSCSPLRHPLLPFGRSPWGARSRGTSHNRAQRAAADRVVPALAGLTSPLSPFRRDAIIVYAGAIMCCSCLWVLLTAREDVASPYAPARTLKTGPRQAFALCRWVARPRVIVGYSRVAARRPARAAAHVSRCTNRRPIFTVLCGLRGDLGAHRRRDGRRGRHREEALGS